MTKKNSDSSPADQDSSEETGWSPRTFEDPFAPFYGEMLMEEDDPFLGLLVEIPFVGFIAHTPEQHEAQAAIAAHRERLTAYRRIDGVRFAIRKGDELLRVMLESINALLEPLSDEDRQIVLLSLEIERLEHVLHQPELDDGTTG